MQGLDWQTLQLPLAAGLQQKMDDRARSAPYLDIANDVQFDEAGGIQTRYPFAAMGTSIVGGGSISNPRRIVANGSELLLFTDTGLYSWNAQLSKWVLKATHLAVKIDEEPAFVTTDDQVGCDRAELDGVIVYAWATTSSEVYAAAIDKETGSVLQPPVAITTNGNGERPRVVALDTVIHIYWIETPNPTHTLVCLPIDPADVTGTIGDTPITIDDANDYYDVVKVPGSDSVVGAIRLDPTTSYRVFSTGPDPNLTLASSVVARTCDGPIAVSCPPTGTTVQVIRANGTAPTNVTGDLITISGFVDTAHINKAVGTTTGGGSAVYQIAACHRSTQDSGEYRCYVFWFGALSSNYSNGSGAWESKYNYVDTGGNLGTQGTFVRKLAIASRAFDYGGHVYVVGQFVGNSEFLNAGLGSTGARVQLQNTYFLYRDDVTLHAKIAANRGQGEFALDGHLPNVQLTSGSTVFSWCATDRRIIQLTSNGNTTGYDDRGPLDVTMTFDSNEARRCVRLGETLYITGGELLQYDGTQLVEVGFHVFPWYFSAARVASGAVANGTYSYKATYRWDNARGERERSTTATHGDFTVSSGTPQGIRLGSTSPLFVTHKTTPAVAVEFWRTETAPSTDSPFYLVTSKDPADVTGANRYLVNTTASDTLSNFDDELADADLAALEANPENGSVLESLSPPACSIAIASDARLFVGGVAGDPHRVWYSKQRSTGEIAAFHDALTIAIPQEGGAITSLAFLNETLIVFRETAIYALPGDGFDNTGGGANYGPARLLSSDVGAVNHESVVFTPSGLVFKSSKGWYLLNRGWSLDYIGAPVTDYDSETPLAAHLVEKQHQVRILTGSRMLVWDYLVQQWAEWTIADGLHACVWDGSHVYLASTGAKKQGTSYTSLTYGIDVETSWWKPADLQGFSRVRKIQLLGEYRSSDANVIRIRVKYNYDDSTYVDDQYWEISPTTVGGPLQVKIGPSRQQIQAIKIRITPMVRTTVTPEVGDPVTTYSSPTGEAIKLTGIALEVGLKRGLYPRLPAAQRT